MSFMPQKETKFFLDITQRVIKEREKFGNEVQIALAFPTFTLPI